jgi:L-alanine-DL-glutamate epimerase-like enolase superfamily enzyme
MKIASVSASVYRVPTEVPEQDGTFDWDATTAVVAHVGAGDAVGLGWTYSSVAAAVLVSDMLAGVLIGRDAADVAGAWTAMRQACRNLGLRGLVMQAVSAVDVALWDLAGQLAAVPVAGLLGGAGVPVQVYGSGGFTNLSDAQLREQVTAWLECGCRSMKIKIGRDRSRDLDRVRLVRELAPDADVMVDANGAYSRGDARRMGTTLDDLGVVWFEEPVTSDDLAGLRGLREALRCDVAAGEYASDVNEAELLCSSVDCLQLDVTRCGGYTGFLRGAAVAAGHGLQVSGHCAPALHAQLGGVANLRHVEYFVDHARLEPMLFDGVPPVVDGVLVPAPSPGLGVTVRAEAEKFRVDVPA